MTRVTGLVLKKNTNETASRNVTMLFEIGFQIELKEYRAKKSLPPNEAC